jgi:hypothetical protein
MAIKGFLSKRSCWHPHCQHTCPSYAPAPGESLYLSGSIFTKLKSLSNLASRCCVFLKKGKFLWNATGSSILLAGVTNAPDKYNVGENVLIQLDINSNDIKGDNALMYRLQKIK